jgi:hypothetical protein
VINSSSTVNSPSVPSFSVTFVSNSIRNMAIIFSLMVYAPLDLTHLQGEPHVMPTCEYKDCLPKYSGNNAIFVEDHINAFLKFVDDVEIEHEDVVMKTFV